MSTHTFNTTQLIRWRQIDLRTTKRVAEACSKGIDFAGCNKALIYDVMSGRSGGRFVDLDRFTRTMNAVAKELPRLKEELDERVGFVIRDAAEPVAIES